MEHNADTVGKLLAGRFRLSLFIPCSDRVPQMAIFSPLACLRSCIVAHRGRLQTNLSYFACAICRSRPDRDSLATGSSKLSGGHELIFILERGRRSFLFGACSGQLLRLPFQYCAFGMRRSGRDSDQSGTITGIVTTARTCEEAQFPKIHSVMTSPHCL